MLWYEIQTLFSKNWREARVLHKFHNIWVELIRANPRAVTIILYILLFLVIGQTIKVANAEGQTYSGKKIIGCDNPVTREDGTPLAAEEIDRVEMYFIERDDLQGTPAHTHVFSGGCPEVDVEFNLNVLPYEGQWYQFGKTYDTEGRVSGNSNSVPFMYTKAPPSAPVVR